MNLFLCFIYFSFFLHWFIYFVTNSCWSILVPTILRHKRPPHIPLIPIFMQSMNFSVYVLKKILFFFRFISFCFQSIKILFSFIPRQKLYSNSVANKIVARQLSYRKFLLGLSFIFIHYVM